MNDYSEKLQSLSAGPSGEFVELEIRQFQDDLEAHDPDLQERYSAEMLAEFDSAIRQCTELWGQPEKRIRWDDPEADTWLERTQVGFIELAYWPRPDGKYLFVAFDHEDRECPMLLIAGISQ